MTLPELQSIRNCLDGSIPSTLATVATDGTPNITLVSQVFYVDPSHVALSFQFFNKTRDNILRNPRATALVIDPTAGTQYRLELEYERTEDSGPLFENMKARLAGIASHTGMAGVFRLRGADVYSVLEVVRVPGQAGMTPQLRRDRLGPVREIAASIARQTDLARLFEDTLEALECRLDIHHAMMLVADKPGRKLYTVASRGYPDSGIGSEIPFGCGVIGVAADQRVPVRISYMTTEYAYGHAIREGLIREGRETDLETEIPFPGLQNSASQLAVPIVGCDELVGILFSESSEDLRFDHEDEDALVAIASHLGAAIGAMRHSAELQEPTVTTGLAPGTSLALPGHSAVVKHYAADDSIFINGDYLIKGVAGAILSKLLTDHLATGRTEFCNKELRLDSGLGLPDISDNLEARLVLLKRRLSERSSPMRIEKTGRGRFRLVLDGGYSLEHVPANQPVDRTPRR